MGKKIIQFVTGKDCELRERMFRTIIIVGGFATLLTIIENFMIMESGIKLLPVMILFLAAIGIVWYLTFKHKRYYLAAAILDFLIMTVIMPLMFFSGGGIEGGAPMWLVIIVLYGFLMFKGKNLFVHLCFSLGMSALLYHVAYCYPEYITPLASKEAVFWDSFLSVVMASMICGLILQVHMRIFEEEHKTNVAQKEELERNRDSKNVFFANMSHEIRTPINAIMGLNEMIMRANPSGETREYALDIQLASKLLLNQVNDILDLSQMEMDKMHIVPVKYKLKTLVEDLTDLIWVQMEKKKLDFKLDIDPGLPSELFGDEKRIRQILLNLLDNAVKYTEEGSVTLSVQGEESNGDEVTLKIKVADTGMGIRKEDMENIYDSFNRIDEKKNAGIMGSGLGLSIVKQLLGLMDGEIKIDSIYKKGTIFTISVKQKISNVKPVGVMSPLDRKMEEGQIYEPDFEAPQARVLVVDDNDMNSMIAKKLLEATKVQVDIAKNGAECLEMTKKKFYHVILLDDMMPGMNGRMTLQEIRSQENGLCRESAVIAMTGNAIADARQVYEEQGFDGYVGKPIQGKVMELEILRFLPAEIIEYQKQNITEAQRLGQIQKIVKKRRKKIYITSDCACDIPAELLEKYDIKVMYLYIKTPYGRFADTREIDSDSLEQYMSTETSSATPDSVTVEEFEEFFAEALTEAESVIHISLGSRAGKSYGIAVAAAKGFGHVHVVDSAQISCGQGLITLHAARLATENKSVEEIIDAVNKMHSHVQTAIVMPGADIFYRNGRTNSAVAKLCNMLELHPYVTMRHKNAVVSGLLGGSVESAWKKGIRHHLRKKRKINKDVVFITYVGCSVKQQELIKREVLKCIPFKRVIMQKASFTVACNSGMQTIGVAYYSM